MPLDSLLACVFAFTEEARRRPLYFIYKLQAGSFHPVVRGASEHQRDTESELRLKAQSATSCQSSRDGAVVPALGRVAVGLRRPSPRSTSR